MNYLCQEPLFDPLWSIIKSLTYLSIYIHISVTWATLHENNLKSNVTGETKSNVNRSLEEEGAKYCKEYFYLHFFPQTWNGMLLEELVSVKVHLLWTSDNDYWSILKLAYLIYQLIFFLGLFHPSKSSSCAFQRILLGFLLLLPKIFWHEIAVWVSFVTWQIQRQLQ